MNPTRGLWISNEILSLDIDHTDMMLLARVEAFGVAGCVLSNTELSAWLKIYHKAVSKRITALTKTGYLHAFIDKNKANKRTLRLAQNLEILSTQRAGTTPPREDSTTPPQEDSKAMVLSLHEGIGIPPREDSTIPPRGDSLSYKEISEIKTDNNIEGGRVAGEKIVMVKAKENKPPVAKPPLVKSDIPFAESDYYDIETFTAHLNTQHQNLDVQYYHRKIANWNDQHGRPHQRANWKATINQFLLNDYKAQQLIFNSTTQIKPNHHANSNHNPGSNHRSQWNAEDTANDAIALLRADRAKRHAESI